MGYYVTTVASTIRIPHERVADAYERVCALNAPDSGAERRRVTANANVDAHVHKTRNPDPTTALPGLPWNFDETCPTLESVLAAAGFEIELSPAGDVTQLTYDGKSLCEDEILAAIAPDVEPGSLIILEGEDGCRRRLDFDGRAMTTRYDDLLGGWL